MSTRKAGASELESRVETLADQLGKLTQRADSIAAAQEAFQASILLLLEQQMGKLDKIAETREKGKEVEEASPQSVREGPPSISTPRELPRVGLSPNVVYSHFEDPGGNSATTQPLVVLAENHVLNARLRHLGVDSVYRWLRQIQEYEWQHGVRVRRAAFVDQAVLSYLAIDHFGSTTEASRTMSNEKFTSLLMEKLAQDHHTPRALCECARTVVPFPPVVHRQGEHQTERARQELSVVPVYLANLLRFEEFCQQYGLLPQGWPAEDNKAEAGPVRLHEVVRAVIARNAPFAWTLLQAEAFSARKLTVVQMAATLRAACHDKIAKLAAGSEMVRKLTSMPSQALPGKPYYSQTTSRGSRVFEDSARSESRGSPRPPPKTLQHLDGPNWQHNEELDQDEDIAEHDAVWHEATGEEETTETNSVGLPTPHSDGIESLHAIKSDKSSMACHGFMFSEEGCHYQKEGKTCPYSHDIELCLREADAAKARLRTKLVKK